MLVYVLKQNGQPFMPTARFGKVRRLLKAKKAKVVRREPFTIKLLYEPETDVVQECYCGDNDIWRMPALCLRKEGTVIKKGDRICQFRIAKNQPDVHLVEVKHLGNQDRGGFGSTGTN